MSKTILRTLLPSLFFVFFSLCGSISITRAQSTGPEQPSKPVPDRGPIPQIPLSAPTIRTPSKSLPLSPSSGEGWVKVVYQTYKDNNWEVYYALANGYVRGNLSNSSAADARPKLSRDDRRVVFNSDRSNNVDIYTVYTDGTGLTRLTTNKFQDYAPDWSPDGSRIVYVSNHGAKTTSPTEVYVMNSDGSNQTRLTFGGNYNTSPTWSSDGKQIAWVVYSGIYGAIYVMNADGSNQHALTPMLPYLDHPVWSPSGTRIAVDFDADGDTWNELVFMNSDGSGAHIVYNPPGAMQDAWMGSWLAIEDKIAYTLVQYIVYQGKYYIDYSHVLELYVDEQTTNAIEWGDYNMLPDWLALDIYAPVSQVNPLPAFSRADGFDISWSGVDVGISGIGMFYAQYRVGALGTWQDLNPYRTSNNTAHFSGQPGNMLYFRVAAEDGAENMEAWPPGDGDTSTTLFTYLLNGTVRDQRNYPVPNTTVDIQPAPWETSLVSDLSGNYSAHLLNIGQTSLGGSHPGYGPINDRILASSADSTAPLYLNPEPDLIQNGSIEEGLSDWSITGTLTATMGAPYSGANAVSLGDACVAPCLSGAEQPFHASLSDFPSTATDKDGNLHVIWGSLNYSVRDVQGHWSTPVQLTSHGSTGNTEDIKPAIAVDPLGTVYVLVTGEDGIYYYQKPAGGSWTGGENIGAGWLPAIAVNDQGVVYVTFCQQTSYEIVYRVRPLSGVWDPPVSIGDEYQKTHSDVAIGPDGVVHFVSVSDTGYLYHQALLLDGTLTAKDYFYQPGFQFLLLGTSRIVVDAYNRIHFLSDNGADLGQKRVYLYWDKNGSYSGPIFVTQNNLISADMAVDSMGGVHIVGIDHDDHTHLRYYYLRRGSLTFQDYSFNFPWAYRQDVSIAIDKLDTIHLTYASEDALEHRQSIFATEDQEETLSQSITLPPGINKPTLAYMISLTAPGNWSKSGYAVDITSDQSKTRIYSSTHAESWTHRWADLTPWVGKSITVTYVLNQVAGEPFVHLSLDDISAGAWSTPLPLNVSPDRVRDLSASPVVSITGQNFVSTPVIRMNGITITDVVWIDEHTLQFTLPPGFEPGVYSVCVVNPGGQEGYLSQFLIVGNTNYLPMIRR